MQAARGASLSSSDPESPDGQTSPQRPGRRVALFLVVGVLGWLLDQVTKHLAVTRLSGRPPVHVVGDLLQLTLVRNPGAAFGTGAGITWVFAVIGIVAAVVVVYAGVRSRTSFWAVGLGLLLAGVLGNLTDRMFRAPGPFRGQVIDFLMLPHWPVFNVADVCIDIAAAIIVVQALRGVRLDGSRARADEPDRT